MEEFPKLKAAGVEVAEFVQLPGEVVYIPEGWPVTLGLCGGGF